MINGKKVQANKFEQIIFDVAKNTRNSEIIDIANKFNEYYITSMKDILLSIDGRDVIEEEVEGRKINEWTEFKVITEEVLRRIIYELPTKKGTDEGISTEMLNDMYDVIKVELLLTINSLLEEGICPEEWKLSTVIPIPKVAMSVKASEYRPINVLPIYEIVIP